MTTILRDNTDYCRMAIFFTAQAFGQHLGALLLFLFICFWPGVLAHEPSQNWYVPLLRGDGVVDGGLMIVLALEMVCLLAIIATVAYSTAHPAAAVAPSYDRTTRNGA